MLAVLKRFILFLIPFGVLCFVIFYIEPPKSWDQASVSQILLFFIPFLLSITFLVDIYFDYLPYSFIVGLCGMVIIVLSSLNQLNYISGTIVLILMLSALRFFPKVRLPRFRLTKRLKIPKLSRLR